MAQSAQAVYNPFSFLELHTRPHCVYATFAGRPLKIWRWKLEKRKSSLLRLSLFRVCGGNWKRGRARGDEGGGICREKGSPGKPIENARRRRRRRFWSSQRRDLSIRRSPPLRQLVLHIYVYIFMCIYGSVCLCLSVCLAVAFQQHHAN